MTVVRRLAAAVVLAGLVPAGLVACASDPDPVAPPEATVEPSEPTDPTSYPPLVAGAVADLATMLDVEQSAIELVSQEEVTWRDGSLGCAKPGMMYTQALVDGSRIVLRADGTDYEYHSGGGRPAFHCPAPTE